MTIYRMLQKKKKKEYVPMDSFDSLVLYQEIMG
jgi:hypothetical protein